MKSVNFFIIIFFKLADGGGVVTDDGDASDAAGVCGGDGWTEESASRDKIWKTMGRTRAVSKILELEFGSCGAGMSSCGA